MRVVSASALSLFICALFMPFFISKMKALQWGQSIRPEGPQEHQKKSGTPTMGGVVIVLSIIPAFFLAGIDKVKVIIFAVLVLFNALIGFADDLIQVRKKRSLGLRARDKLAAQTILGLLLGLFMLYGQADLPSRILVPGGRPLDSPALFLVLTVLVLVGTTNAVNLTDGLDGLAGGTVAVASLAYVFLLSFEGMLELSACASAIAGACIGFLWHNCYPARIFMGDTGSLALGGGLAALAILSGTHLYLLLIGGVFVLEALSVIIQVVYFKLTHGRRVFRMSPLHHHFGLSGWEESQVTVRFWILGAVFALLGLMVHFG